MYIRTGLAVNNMIFFIELTQNFKSSKFMKHALNMHCTYQNLACIILSHDSVDALHLSMIKVQIPTKNPNVKTFHTPNFKKSIKIPGTQYPQRTEISEAHPLICDTLHFTLYPTATYVKF